MLEIDMGAHQNIHNATATPYKKFYYYDQNKEMFFVAPDMAGCGYLAGLYKDESSWYDIVLYIPLIYRIDNFTPDIKRNLMRFNSHMKKYVARDQLKYYIQNIIFNSISRHNISQSILEKHGEEFIQNIINTFYKEYNDKYAAEINKEVYGVDKIEI